MNIGKRFTYLRGGKTKKDYAEFLEITPTVVSDIENEKIEPSRNIMRILLNKQNVNINWLLTGEGEPFLQKDVEPEKPTVVKELEEIALSVTAPKFQALEDNLTMFKNDIQEQIEALKKAQQNPHSGDLIYETPPSYSSSLVDDYEEEEEPTIPIAYAEHLAAGKPSQAYETGETYLVRQSLIKGNPANYYAVRISGSSMTQAGIKDGAVVLLQKCQEAKASAIMVVRYRDNTTLKRLSQDKDNWHLSYEDGTNRIIKLYKGEWSVIAEFIAVVG